LVKVLDIQKLLIDLDININLQVEDLKELNKKDNQDKIIFIKENIKKAFSFNILEKIDIKNLNIYGKTVILIQSTIEFKNKLNCSKNFFAFFSIKSYPFIFKLSAIYNIL
jgi:hypothetical protein